MAINSVSFVGNITFDPELKATQSGMQILSFNVAINEKKKNNSTGEWEDAPVFVGCTMFGKRAESISRYISKGSRVAVDGRLHYSQWEKDGEKRNKLDVIVDNIEFMSRKGENTNQSSSAGATTQIADVYDEDVPF